LTSTLEWDNKAQGRSGHLRLIAGMEQDEDYGFA
jgi:hypothetical protein